MPQKEKGFTIKIDVSGIKATARALEKMPNLLRNVTLMRVLNRLGGMAKSHVTREVAKQAGVLQREARLGIVYHEATPNDLEYTIEVQGSWVRGLVYIITQQDDKVCPQCIAAEKGGPYTADQLAEIKRGHEHSGIVHHNCRCYTIPASRTLQEGLSREGDIMGTALDIVHYNAATVMVQEVEYAMTKLKADLGSGH